MPRAAALPQIYVNAIRFLAGVLLLLTGIGCCGIPNYPAINQTRAWTSKYIPPGSAVAGAAELLKSEGYSPVYIDSHIEPHELKASKHIGFCFLFFVYDDLYVTSTLDKSDRIVKTSVSTGVSPGI